MLAYVTGFDGNSFSQKAFESQWKRAREHRGANLNSEGVAELALMVISQRKQQYRQEDLRFIRTGTILRD